MSKLNKSIISENQTILLPKRIDTALNGVDVNYLGYDREFPDKKIDLFKTDANVNRVLFWLSSKHDDYIRESFKGGVLYDLLGKINNETNLSEWESIITSKFNSEFSGDLELTLLKLTTDNKYRKLYINMIVRDKVGNIVFPVSTEASL